MTNQDYKLRTSIWDALSNFYLDTELNDTTYDYIHNVFIDSQLDLATLKAIDLYDVFTCLQQNLLCLTGAWAGFDSDWLHKKCLENYKKRKSSNSFRIYTRLKNKLHYWMRKRHWLEIERRFSAAI